MKRDLSSLHDTSFDLLVIGGGVFGACAARDAAERGLRVALIERHDFASATSASHLKMVHGGIRYLQHGDVYRLRQSSGERRAWLRTAPHLVRPLPIVIPTYGHGMKGKAALRFGMGMYDLLAADRNRGIRDRSRHVPPGRTMSRDDVLRLFPALPPTGLTGAGVFCDGQIYNPPRLVLAVIRKAEEAGAVVANYVAATGFVRKGREVVAVQARDHFSGAQIEIRARMVLNAAGPYAERLLERGANTRLRPPGTYSRDACFVVPRNLLGDRFGLAVQGTTRDPDARLSRGARHLFLAPWRNATLVGVWHVVHERDPDDFTVTDDELTRFIAEVNGAYAGLNLRLEDVAFWNAGLVPFGENRPGDVHLRYGHRSRLVDHAGTDGIDNLVTLIGVRFTTGRTEAENAISLILRKLGRSIPPGRTAEEPVHGGDLNTDFATHVADVAKHLGDTVPHAAAESLATNYGSKYADVVRPESTESDGLELIPGTHTLKAQLRYAVRSEMAFTLGDVVFRRTDLATSAYPGRAALRECAEVVASELGWDEVKIEKEIDHVVARFAPRMVRQVDAETIGARP